MQKDRAGFEPKPAKPVPEAEPGEGTVVPVGNGRVYGYARVSRSDSQDHAHQVSALRIAGATKIFTDEISGGVPTGDRPGFRDALSHLRPGDVLVAAEMSRISRSLTDLITTIEVLTAQGVTVRVLGLGDLDSTSATGRLMIGLLGLVAEFERSLIRARTISGIANARRAGVRIGRPPALDAQGTRTLIAMKSAGASVPEICVALSVSERTVRRVLIDHAGRTSAADRDSIGVDGLARPARPEVTRVSDEHAVHPLENPRGDQISAPPSPVDAG